MSTPRHASHALEAEDAVLRVLEAERIARAQVTGCESDAARLVDEANARAQAVRDRTAARVERLSSRMDAQAQERLAQIRAERERLAGETGVDPATLARLQSAIGILVAEIAGDEAEFGKG